MHRRGLAPGLARFGLARKRFAPSQLPGAAGTRESWFRCAAMRARNLDSAMISRVAFDEEESRLSIWFRNSGRYIYEGVPRSIYEALCKASSAGSFFNEGIRGRYPGRRDPRERRFRPG